MAKLPGKFNAEDHEEMGTYDAIPAGKYPVKVSGNKVKDNKAKIAAAKEGKTIPGSVYTISFEITEGQYKGRILFTGLNLEHTSEQTVDLAYRELTSITKACGKTTVLDLDELNGCDLTVTVKVVEATPKYPASNKISKYEPLKGAAKPNAGKSSGPSGAKKPSGPKVSFD